MPIVPITRQPISMDVPAGPSDLGNAGIVQNALAKSAGQVSDASMNLFAQIRHAEAQSVVLSKQQEQTDQAQQWLEVQKLKSKDGYAYDDQGQPIKNADGTQKTLTDHYKDWSEKQYQDTLGNLPSPFAQQLYREQMGNFYLGFKDKVWNDEMKMRVANVGDLRDDRMRLQMNKQNLTPNVGQFYSYLDSERKTIKDQQGVIYSSEDVHKVDSHLLKEAPDGLFNGYENSILADKRLEREGVYANEGTRATRIAKAREALSILDGTDPDSLARRQRGMPVLAEVMDPDKRAQWYEKFNKLLEIASKHDSNDWTARANDGIAALMNGDRNPDGSMRFNPTNYKALLDEGAMLNKQGALDDHTFVTKSVAIATVGRASPVMNSWEYYLATPDQKVAIMKNLQDQATQEVDRFLAIHKPERIAQLGAAGASVRGEVMGQLNQIAKRADDEANKDFPKFIRVNPAIGQKASMIQYASPASLASPTVRSTIKSLDTDIENYWSTWHPGQKPDAYLTQDEAKSIGEYLNKGLDNSDKKAEYLLNLHRANPASYNQKIIQMVNNDHLPPQWLVALSIKNDRTFTTALVDSIANPAKNADATLQAQDVGVGSFKADIYKKTASYVDALILSNPNSPVVSRISDSVQNLVFNMAVKKVQTEGVSPSSALDSVVGAVVDGRYFKTKVTDGTLGLFAQQSYRIPRFVQGQELSDTDQGYIAANMRAYKNGEKVAAMKPDLPVGLDPRLNPQRYYDKVAETMKFRFNASQTSVIPTWYDESHQQRVDVLKNGKPMELPLLELRQYNHENNTLLQKLGEKISGAASSAASTVKDAFKNSPLKADVPKEPF